MSSKIKLEFKIERALGGGKSKIKSVVDFGSPFHRVVSSSDTGVRIWDSNITSSGILVKNTSTLNIHHLIKFDAETFMFCSDDNRILSYSIQPPYEMKKGFLVSSTNVLRLLLLKENWIACFNFSNELFVIKYSNGNVKELESQSVNKNSVLINSKNCENCFFINTNDEQRSIKLIDYHANKVMKVFGGHNKKKVIYTISTYINSRNEEILISCGESKILFFYNTSLPSSETKEVTNSIIKRVKMSNEVYSSLIMDNFLFVGDFKGSFHLYTLPEEVEDDEKTKKKNTTLHKVMDGQLHTGIIFHFRPLIVFNTPRTKIIRMITCSQDQRVYVFRLSHFSGHDFYDEIFSRINNSIKQFLQDNYKFFLKPRTVDEIHELKRVLIRSSLKKYLMESAGVMGLKKRSKKTYESSKKQKERPGSEEEWRFDLTRPKLEYEYLKHVIPDHIKTLETQFPNLIDRKITLYFGQLSKTMKYDGFGMEFTKISSVSVNTPAGAIKRNYYAPFYIGLYSNGIKDGKGSLYEAKTQKLKFQGIFKNNLRHGPGKEYFSIYSPSNIPSEGEDSKENSPKKASLVVTPTKKEENKLSSSLMVSFKGRYSQGKREGRGEEVKYEGGQVVRGMWKSGQLVDDGTLPLTKFPCHVLHLDMIEKHCSVSRIYNHSTTGVTYRMKISDFPSYVFSSYYDPDVKDIYDSDFFSDGDDGTQKLKKKKKKKSGDFFGDFDGGNRKDLFSQEPFISQEIHETTQISSTSPPKKKSPPKRKRKDSKIRIGLKAIGLKGKESKEVKEEDQIGGGLERDSFELEIPDVKSLEEIHREVYVFLTFFCSPESVLKRRFFGGNYFFPTEEGEDDEEEDASTKLYEQFKNRMFMDELQKRKFQKYMQQKVKRELGDDTVKMSEEKLFVSEVLLRKEEPFQKVFGVVKGSNQIGVIHEYFPTTIHQVFFSSDSTKQINDIEKSSDYSVIHDGDDDMEEEEKIRDEMDLRIRVCYETAVNMMVLHSLSQVHQNLSWKNVILVGKKVNRSQKKGDEEKENDEVKKVVDNYFYSDKFDVKLKGFFERNISSENDGLEFCTEDGDYYIFIKEKMRGRKGGEDYQKKKKKKKKRKKDEEKRKIGPQEDFKKFDVFCFGIMLFSLLRQPQDTYKKIPKEEEIELFDEEDSDEEDYNFNQKVEHIRKEISKYDLIPSSFRELILSCVGDDFSKRPNFGVIIRGFDEYFQQEAKKREKEEEEILTLEEQKERKRSSNSPVKKKKNEEKKPKKKREEEDEEEVEGEDEEDEGVEKEKEKEVEFSVIDLEIPEEKGKEEKQEKEEEDMKKKRGGSIRVKMFANNGENSIKVNVDEIIDDFVDF